MFQDELISKEREREREIEWEVQRKSIKFPFIKINYVKWGAFKIPERKHLSNKKHKRRSQTVDNRLLPEKEKEEKEINHERRAGFGLRDYRNWQLIIVSAFKFFSFFFLIDIQGGLTGTSTVKSLIIITQFFSILEARDFSIQCAWTRVWGRREKRKLNDSLRSNSTWQVALASFSIITFDINDFTGFLPHSAFSCPLTVRHFKTNSASDSWSSHRIYK